jgi:hypothetical protein
LTAQKRHKEEFADIVKIKKSKTKEKKKSAAPAKLGSGVAVGVAVPAGAAGIAGAGGTGTAGGAGALSGAALTPDKKGTGLGEAVKRYLLLILYSES